MALVLNDRVKETTTTTGTGTVNLAGAETGFETFVAGIGNTNTTYYAIVHQTADEFEVGLGTVSDSSPDTLSRTTIISSSNSDSAVNFSAGTKAVFCTLPASKAVFVDGSGDLEFNAPGDEFSFKNSSNTIAFIKTDNNDFTIQNNLNDKDFILKGYDADGDGLITGLTIDYSNSGDAVFRRQITCREAIYINTADNSATTGYLYDSSGDFVVRNFTQDKDIVFKGNDGGSIIDALTLDMSEEGDATFNNNIKFGDNGKALFGAGTDLAIFSDGTDGKIEASGTLILDADGTTISLRDGGTENSQIGLDSAGLVMTVIGADKDFFISGNDGGSAITGVRVDFSDAGAIICNGNITAFGNTSDIKLKENIEVIPNALDKVKQLKGITFNYKKDGKVSTGLIAQDLEKVLPEAVYESSDIDNDEDKHLAIRYGNTVGLLVEAIKELEARVKELEDK